MDTTDLEINFGENGYCNHCIEYLNIRVKYKYQGKESNKRLEQIVDEIKRLGKGNDYDCIIGLSGGIDSSYLTYIAKEKGLRILAVYMDNGWSSEEAVGNIKKITKKLKIDYESYVLDWEEFKDLQLSFLKASVPEAETPTDIAIPAALHYFADKYNVKNILSGGNFATEGILPKSWHYNAKDLKYFNHIQKTFGGKRLKKFPTFGYKKEIYYKLIKGIRIAYPLNHVYYVKDEAIELLKEKFDWKYYGSKHYESTYTKFIQSYYLYQKFGIDYRRATLSSQICIGGIDREDAIEQLKSKPFNLSQIEAEKEYIAKKLGISKDEFDRILHLTAKWYWDYPNDDKKLGFIYDTYRKLFNKEKLGSF
jgi:N-acetyl sugar amidotransferase